MKKVVIADDDPIVRHALSRIVERMGICCVTCSTGLRALQVLEDNPEAALLITDVCMPELSGPDLVGLLRSRESMRTLPVVVMSGVTRYEDITAILDMGAARFLTKPVDLQELRDCLTTYLPLSFEGRLRGSENCA